jgi:hypothetical protein
MINTNELMLGNLVSYEGHYAIITTISNDYVLATVGERKEHCIVPIDINPIELTDEILKRLGQQSYTLNDCFELGVNSVHKLQIAHYEKPLDITPLLKPKAILTTHDGVEITSEDATIWMCYRSGINCNGKKDNPSRTLVKTQLTNQFKDKLHYFSTREASVNYINTKWAELHPEPIFVTEDGVGMFEGMEYFFCYKSGINTNGCKDFPASHITFTANLDDKYIRFSTKELAQSYLNKVWSETEYNNLLKAKSEQ